MRTAARSTHPAVPRARHTAIKAHAVPAAVFKANCLQLMDRVRETGAEYVVTKHGRPVAKLVPYAPGPARSVFGAMRGTVLHYERPFDRVEGEYDIDGE
jgi:prevent-host-death family protein